MQAVDDPARVVPGLSDDSYLSVVTRFFGESSLLGMNYSTRDGVGRPKVGLGIYIYSCHAGELFGFVPVARDEQAFSC